MIARGCRISEDKQVLLVSGGESLDPVATVGKYHAGTVRQTQLTLNYSNPGTVQSLCNSPCYNMDMTRSHGFSHLSGVGGQGPFEFTQFRKISFEPSKLGNLMTSKRTEVPF